jgi:hypothetical protein
MRNGPDDGRIVFIQDGLKAGMKFRRAHFNQILTSTKGFALSTDADNPNLMVSGTLGKDILQLKCHLPVKTVVGSWSVQPDPGNAVLLLEKNKFTHRANLGMARNMNPESEKFNDTFRITLRLNQPKILPLFLFLQEQIKSELKLLINSGIIP